MQWVVYVVVCVCVGGGVMCIYLCCFSVCVCVCIAYDVIIIELYTRCTYIDIQIYLITHYLHSRWCQGNTLHMFAYNLLFQEFNHSYHHTCSMIAKHLDSQQTTQMEQCHSPMRNLFNFIPMKCVSSGLLYIEQYNHSFGISIEIQVSTKHASISVNTNCISATSHIHV